jgi:hypothetical protein
LDIDTWETDITKVTWGWQALSAADDDDAVGMGLWEGHLVFYIKANTIPEDGKTVTLWATGKADTTLTFKFDGTIASAQ